VIKQRKTVYLVEGEDEEKIVSELKTELQVIRPGKIYVVNIVQEKLTKPRAATWGSNVDVVLVFDTDVRRTSHFDNNIAFLHRLKNVHEVIFVPQVRNLEDELLRSTTAKHIREITKSRTDEEWKGDLRKCRNLEQRLQDSGFDMQKFWNTLPYDDFADIPNQSDKIRIRQKR
jgi:hypothetical protein